MKIRPSFYLVTTVLVTGSAGYLSGCVSKEEKDNRSVLKDIFDTNSPLAESDYTPDYSIIRPSNFFVFSEMYVPGANLAVITGTKGDIVYTFVPSDDPRFPNFGNLSQAYITESVELRPSEDGSYADPIVIAKMTPIGAENLQVIELTGRNASRNFLNGLEAVAVTDLTLTKEFYRQYPEETPTTEPSFEQTLEFERRRESGDLSPSEAWQWKKRITGASDLQPQDLGLISAYGVCANAVVTRDENGHSHYTLYSYINGKTFINPTQAGEETRIEVPGASLPLDVAKLPPSKQRIIFTEITEILEDPDKPGGKIMTGRGHVTSRPEVILFGQAATAFAAADYVTARKTVEGDQTFNNITLLCLKRRTGTTNPPYEAATIYCTILNPKLEK
ncbi:MAG: hypothetical protein L6Q57_07255 [Alphaproteobacteria bacterium]|nr:hypothetical protein [Alphaproteobacteria bacterium]